MKINTLSKIIVFINGHMYLYTIGKKEYYLHKCSKHGYQLVTPKGYRERLECNECLQEQRLLYS